MINKNNIQLEITDQEASFLLTGLIDFYHKLLESATYEHLADETKDKIVIVKKLWQSIEDQTGIGKH
jgi:hypothetical protein